MKKKIALISILALVAFQVHANLVQNGDFSNGFSNWTHTGPSGWTHIGYGPAPFGYVWNEGAVGGVSFESQTLSTTPGTYNIDFWLHPFGGAVSDYQVSFGGVTLFDVINTGSGETFLNGSAADVVGGSFVLGAWNEIQLVGTATGNSTDIQFGIRQDPSYSQLTDVSVTGASRVPDGGTTVTLLGIAIAGLAAVRRKLS